jgi:hypothetical protein
MKKLIYSFAAFIIGINIVNAKQVDSGVAQQVAENFIKQNAAAKMKMPNLALALSYTEKSIAGAPDYYVFDINNNTGFVIVSAEDAGHPIIGYSTEASYQIPSETINPNLNYWMQERKAEIEYMRDHNLQASVEIANEWTNYVTNKISAPHTMTTATGPLVQSHWGQGGGYNSLCPGGSAVGCVSTAMSQIMRYWKFPLHGFGSNSYNEVTYGPLSVNFATETYNWTSMSLNSPSSDAAIISYDCGVSVNMKYSPGASSAMVCGNPGAQFSFPMFFGYDPAIACNDESAYTDPVWIGMLEAEFTAGRPVQYQGVDASAGGHTWVADGNDATDKIHMNWGWDGGSDGYYAVTSVTPSGYNFSTQHAVLFPIKPLILYTNDAGVSLVGSPNGTVCSLTFIPSVTIKNFGTSALTSCTINYKVDNGTLMTQSWTGNLAPYQPSSQATAVVTLPAVTSTAGAHTFTSYTSNPNGSTDGQTTNDQTVNNFTLSPGGTALALPIVQGFDPTTWPPSGWSLSNNGNKNAWLHSSFGHSSAYSAYFNNCNPTDTAHGLRNQLRTSAYDFTNPVSPKMFFDVSYAAWDAKHCDSLAVYSSTDCGTTWKRIYYKGGTNLATVPCMMSNTVTCGPYADGSGCYKPTTAATWRTDTIDLSSLVGSPSVVFAFENIAGYGSGLFIDNVNIAGLVGVASINSPDGFSIYPNPASTEFTIEGASTAERIHYAIYNIVGAEISAGDIGTNGSSFNGKIQVSDISRGMYFIKVSDGKNTWTKKLNLQ